MRRLAWIALFCAGDGSGPGPRRRAGNTPVAMREFTVLERITPVDPMAERPTQWANPLVGLTDLVYATSCPAFAHCVSTCIASPAWTRRARSWSSCTAADGRTPIRVWGRDSGTFRPCSLTWRSRATRWLRSNTG